MQPYTIRSPEHEIVHSQYFSIIRHSTSFLHRVIFTHVSMALLADSKTSHSAPLLLETMFDTYAAGTFSVISNYSYTNSRNISHINFTLLANLSSSAIFLTHLLASLSILSQFDRDSNLCASSVLYKPGFSSSSVTAQLQYLI